MTSAPHGPRATGLAALLALLALVVGPVLVGAAAVAAPRGSQSSTPTTTGEAHRENATGFASISINGVRPTVVTTTTGPTVVVEGTVRNTGDRVLRALTIRLQRGQPAHQAAGLRVELAAEPATFEINGEFQPLVDRLAPGASTGFSLRMPLTGPGGLRITEPGVFPLLVNLNATPEYGAQARIADSRTLLPVLSLPPDPDRARRFAQDPAGAARTGLGPDGSIAVRTGSAALFTMLWPLAAPPQTVPGRVGAGASDRVLLVSEDLARSVAPGGRLHNLLAGLRPVMSAATDDPRAAVRDSLCIAVDPDLLVTVSAMTRGYAVLRDPTAPTGSTIPGTGQAAAAAWLAELTSLAAGHCVVALPFANADLDALHRVSNTALTRLAVDHPADVVDHLLGVKSTRGVTLPAFGGLSDDGSAELAKAQMATALVASGSVAPRTRSDPAGQYLTGRVRVATFDAPISAALGAAGSRPRTPPRTVEAQRVALSAESAVSRRQAALAALAFPSIAVPDPRFPARPDDPLPVTGRSSLIAPPVFWSITPDDAVDLVATAGLLLRSGAATPMTLPALVEATAKARQPAALADPPGQRWWLPPARDASSIDASANLTWQLQAALVSPADSAGETPTRVVTPERYMSPLRYDLLRALPGPDDDAADTRTRLGAARTARVAAVAATLQRMRTSVSILDPGGKYTQVSERSPLLLVTRNELALPIRVRIETAAPLDFSIGDIGIVELPARGTRQVQFPVRSENSESTSVTFTLVSASGVLLGGDPIKLSVNSNAYGKPLFIVTLIAAGLLVLLVARRLWHRFHGTPDPADADRPEASVQDRFLAGRDYSWRHGEAAQESVHGTPDVPDD